MTRKSAVLLVLTGGTLMSFVGLILRHIDGADGFQILFYRSFSLSAMVMVVACLLRGVRPAVFLRSLDRRDLVVGGLLGWAFTSYVFAMLLSTIASTLFLLSAAPVFAALLGWAAIAERPRPLTWAVIIAALAGIGLMVGDGLSGGRLIGNLLALSSALAFAAMLVFIRWSGKPDALGGTFLGGLAAAAMNGAAALTVGAGLAIGGADLLLCIFMGAFTIGLGIALVTWGASHIPAAEVSVLVLIESVLGPFWVWLFLNETASRAELIGGAIVLVSVVVLAGAGRPIPAYRSTSPTG